MSKLADLIGNGYEIPYGNGSFPVHGLTLEDVTFLLKENYKVVAEIFEGKMALEDVLTQIPELGVSIISRGCDEAPEVVKKLPFGLQLKAAEKIWELTAVSAEDLGKMVRSLVDGLKSVQGQLPLKSGKVV